MTSRARPARVSCKSAQRDLNAEYTNAADESRRAGNQAADSTALPRRERIKGVASKEAYGFEMRNKAGEGKLAGRSQLV